MNFILKKIILSIIFGLSAGLIQANDRIEEHFWIYVHGTKNITVARIPLKRNQKHEQLFNEYPGFVKATDIPEENSVRSIDKTLSENGLAHCKKENFYYLVWNGNYCNLEREKTSLLLEKGLTDLTKACAQKNTVAIFHIVTHSYGGDVALKMAGNKSSGLNVKELILLGFPVRKESKVQAENTNLFESITNVYSTKDSIQHWVPQQRLSLTGKRTFKCDRVENIKVPDEWNIGHKQFDKQFFLSKLPGLLKTLKPLKTDAGNSDQ